MAKEVRMVDERQVKHSKAKLMLWIVWLLIMAISAAYCAMSFVAFERIEQVYNDDNDNISSRSLWSVLTATMLCPAMIVAFFVLGTLLLLRKTVAESGLTYSFGALHFSTLWMAVLTLQSSLSLHAFKKAFNFWEDTRTDWDEGSTTLAQATYIFGYALSILYVILFILLFVYRGAAKKIVLEDAPTVAVAKVPEEASADLKKPEEV